MSDFRSAEVDGNLKARQSAAEHYLELSADFASFINISSSGVTLVKV